jgi:hypothetical protein
MSKRSRLEDTSRKQKREYQRNNKIEYVPNVVANHYSQFLQDEDIANLSSTSKSISVSTKSMKNCHKETQTGLACANNALASVKLREECFHFCQQHLQLVISNLIDTFLHTEVIADNGIFTFHKCGILQGMKSLSIDQENNKFVLTFGDLRNGEETEEIETHESIQTFFKKHNIIWTSPYIYFYFTSENKTPGKILHIDSYLGPTKVVLNPNNFIVKYGYIEATLHVTVPIIEETKEVQEEMKEEVEEVQGMQDMEENINCLQLTKSKLGCTGLLKRFIVDPKCKQFCNDVIVDAIIDLLNLLTTYSIFGQDETGWTFEFSNWELYVWDAEGIIYEKLWDENAEYQSENFGNIVAENVDLESSDWIEIRFVLPKSGISHPILGERKSLTNLILQTPTEDLQLQGFEEDEDFITLTILNPLNLNMNEPD